MGAIREMSMIDRLWQRFAGQDRWIPWAFVGFFVVLIAVNAVMVSFALNSWPGVESANAYEDGLAYNKTLADARRQDALGWRYGFAFKQAGAEAAHIEITLHDHDGLALTQAAVSARLVRPTSEGHDFDVEIPGDGTGRFAADVALPLPGVWEVRVAVAHPTGTYRHVERIFVR
jgi:nitrogen fixation protein FixH